MERVLEEVATHIPDIVLQRPYDAPITQTVHSYGVIVFADISGFTALCEKYCSGSKSKLNGTDQLTTSLNSYLSQIVQWILEDDGDILKFAGDALLAFWSCSRFTVSGMLNHVLQESLIAQNHFDNFQTSDGVTLRMKLGLSVGKVEFHYFGNEHSRIFDVTGDAIDDANTAQNYTKSGAIAVSKLAWEICQQDKCTAKLVGPGCAQISKIKSEDISLAGNSINVLIGNIPKKRKSIDAISTKELLCATKLGPNPWEEKQRRKSIPERHQQELNLRMKVRGILPVQSEAQKGLCNYVIPTVLQKIENGHNVNWLSELREVSVIFINIVPGKVLNASDTLNLLQSSFDIVYLSLSKYTGILNKVFTFDKGCTFLCIFGLPHARYKESASSALRAAKDIYNDLNSLKTKGHHSIGVTTGPAFCGVVGHPQRHEYTVIGQKVNMAARLMTNFPGSITCDETTKTKSLLSDDRFSLQPYIPLKGISDPENIYTFSLEHLDNYYRRKSWDIVNATDIDDLIGRNEEMEVFLEELAHVSNGTDENAGVIVITGAGGIGKTKLLRAMKAKAAMLNFRVVSGIGGLIEQNTPFFTIKTLVTKLLRLDICRNIHERERLLLENITDPNIKELLPLLNDLLVLKFPPTKTTLEMTQYDQRMAELHKLLYSIVHQEALMKPCVFGIDDAHWIDADSWAFLLDLALEPNVILILTTRPLNNPEKNLPELNKILNHPQTKVLILKGLDDENMEKLACQFLYVNSIPKDLKEIIHERSHGVPLWCEELIDTMLEFNYIQLTQDDSDSHKNSLRKPTHRDLGLNSSVHICSGITLGDIPIPDSVTGMILTRIDYMSPNDQMTLKCAAIAGTVFKRRILKGIVPNFHSSMFNASLNTLAEAGIIECAVAAEIRNISSDIKTKCNKTIPLHLHCKCLSKSISPPQGLSQKPFPVVDECQTLQFVHYYFQETAYSLWTESQKRSLHEAAAVFLESQAHKCRNCGSGEFIAGGLRSTAFNACYKKKKFVISRQPSPAGPSSRISRITQADVSFDKDYTQAMEMDRSSGGRSSQQGPSAISQEDSRKYEIDYTLLQGNEGEKLKLQFQKIFSSGNRISRMNVEDCYCIEVIAEVYPQLVRHWRLAGNLQATIMYLIEAGSGAVATGYNMEALSFLQEARDILENDPRSTVTTILERGRLESFIGQALCQMGQFDESLPHFQNALRILNSTLPTTTAKASIGLVHHIFKQYLHSKCPSRYIIEMKGDRTYLDTTRCLAHAIYVYQKQGRKTLALTTILARLNAAEEAREYFVYELVESYINMIEWCETFKKKKLANYYFNTAMSYCDIAELGPEDIHVYANLLFVGLRLKLHQGYINEAWTIGIGSFIITKRIRDVRLEYIILPLLFFTSMACYKDTMTREILQHLSRVINQSDDLKAQALNDCCRIDALLEFGIDWQSEHTIVVAAEMCCNENIYYFDEVKRFFLISCLALWHARKGNYRTSHNYGQIAKDLQPIKFDSYLAVRAHSRYTECNLLLTRFFESTHEIANTKKVLKKFRIASEMFPAFEPRYLHFKAYFKLVQKKNQAATHLLNRAIIEATKRGCLYDAEWCERSKKAWFEKRPSLSVYEDDSKENAVYMFILPK